MIQGDIFGSLVVSLVCLYNARQMFYEMLPKF